MSDYHGGFMRQNTSQWITFFVRDNAVLAGYAGGSLGQVKLANQPYSSAPTFNNANNSPTHVINGQWKLQIDAAECLLAGRLIVSSENAAAHQTVNCTFDIIPQTLFDAIQNSGADIGLWDYLKQIKAFVANSKIHDLVNNRLTILDDDDVTPYRYYDKTKDDEAGTVTVTRVAP